MGTAPASSRREARRPARAIRLMIVDDSLVARTVFRRLAEASGGIDVVAVASNAEAALAALANVQVDVVLLDLEMPGTGGLEALPRMIAAAPDARIMVVSSLTVDGAEQTLAALSLGAADTLAKPAGGFDEDYRATLLDRIRTLGACAAEAEERDTGRVKAPVVRRGSPGTPHVLAIGASTGGIHALTQLFAGLPRRPGLPILVTQHLPASFMEVFAKQLRLASGCEALVAQDEMLLAPDRILIAPGDAHMTVTCRTGRYRIRLDRTPQSSGCTPSVDPMFASLADLFGEHALGVVLSGMGRDGAEGAARLVSAGGSILAQDEASCAVWGMPRAVADAGLAAAVLPPDKIAERISASLGAGPWT